jgi:hypothetical protein
MSLREEFVLHMAQVRYVRDASTRDVLNMSKREDFAGRIVGCLLSSLKIKMWKRVLSPQQQMEEESLVLLLNPLWLGGVCITHGATVQR